VNATKKTIAVVAAIAVAIVTALVVFVGGGGRPMPGTPGAALAEKKAPTAPHPPAPSAAPIAKEAKQAVAAPAAGPRLDELTMDPGPSKASDSPIRDGWTTETLTIQLNKRLKKLGKAIAAGDRAAVKALVIDKPHLLGAGRQPGKPIASAHIVLERRAGAPTRAVDVKGVVDGFLGLAKGPLPAKPSFKFKIDHVAVDAPYADVAVKVTTRWPPECKSAACARAERHSRWAMRWKVDLKAKAEHLIITTTLKAAEIAVAKNGPLFEDITGAVLAREPAQPQMLADADTWLARVQSAFASDTIGHQGIAIADVNGDGLDDVYVCSPSGVPNRLLIQAADGTVQDRAFAAGVALLDLSRSALFADFDNDGDQDLVVATRSTDTALGTAVLLFEGDGQGGFKKRAPLVKGGDVHSLAAADYDSDGDLDLYLCLLNADRRIEGGFGIPVPYHDASNGGRNILLSNVGPLKFENVTEDAGLDVRNSRWSYAAAWEDYDNDGDPDLYVANDFGKNNLYRNDKGRFVEVTAKAGVEDISPGMSVSWGDIDRDGDMDLYVSNMYSSAGRRIVPQQRFQAQANDLTKAGFLRHARGNTMFRNNGDGTFTDIANESGASIARWAWGSLLADLNGDGWRDAMVVNGMFTRDDPDDL